MLTWPLSRKLLMMLNSWYGKSLSRPHAKLTPNQSNANSPRTSRTKKNKEEFLVASTPRLKTRERHIRRLKKTRRRKRRQLSWQPLLLQKKELKVVSALPKRNVPVTNIAVELASVKMVIRNSSLKESASIAPPWSTRDSSLNTTVLAVPSQCSPPPLHFWLPLTLCDKGIF